MGASLGPARPCCKQEPSSYPFLGTGSSSPPLFAPVCPHHLLLPLLPHRLSGSSLGAPCSLGSRCGAGQSVVQRVLSVPSLPRAHPSGLTLSWGLENAFLSYSPTPLPSLRAALLSPGDYRGRGLGNATCNLPPPDPGKSWAGRRLEPRLHTLSSVGPSVDREPRGAGVTHRFAAFQGRLCAQVKE